MALTQISTNGIKDATIATADIADDAVNADKLANSINTEIAANTAKTTNATHTGEVTGATALTIADNVVDEANLKISNAGSDGQALTKQSGNTGGLTWATISAGISDIVSDTSPQLGGDLDTNSFEISLDDAHSVKFGDGNDLKIYHTSGDNRIENHGANLYLRTGTSGDETSAVFVNNGAVKLYYDNSLKFETSADGATLTGRLSPAADDSYGLGQASLRWANLFLSGDLDMKDADKIKLGNDDDLQIWHDGTYNRIQSDNSKALVIEADGAIAYLRAKIDEESVRCNPDGAVEIFYDNSKKLQTASHGLNIYNTASTGCLVQIGTSQGTPGFVAGGGTTELGFQDSQQHWTIRGVKDGTVELYYDNSKKFETTSTGVTLTGTLDTGGVILGNSEYITLGASTDGKLYSNGSKVWLDCFNNVAFGIAVGAGNEHAAAFNANGSVDLYYDNSKKFETTSGGIEVTGRIKLSDAVYFVDHTSSTTGMALFGSDNDMKIFHNGTNGVLQNTTGHLYIKGADGHIYFRTNDDTENGMIIQNNGPVELYYDGSKKFETTSKGVKITGASTGLSDGDQIFEVIATGTKIAMGVNEDNWTWIRSYESGVGSRPLVLAGSSEYARFSDDGLSFGGTEGAANSLDDYEQGTWNPNFVGHSTNGSGTYSSRGAWYVKLGRQVTVGGYGSWTAHTGSGNMRINNLPFARKSGDTYAQAGSVLTTNWNYNAGEQAVCYAESGSELLFMQVYDDESWEGMQLDTNAACMFGLSYWTDS